MLHRIHDLLIRRKKDTHHFGCSVVMGNASAQDSSYEYSGSILQVTTLYMKKDFYHETYFNYHCSGFLPCRM